MFMTHEIQGSNANDLTLVSLIGTAITSSPA